MPTNNIESKARYLHARGWTLSPRALTPDTQGVSYWVNPNWPASKPQGLATTSAFHAQKILERTKGSPRPRANMAPRKPQVALSRKGIPEGYWDSCMAAIEAQAQAKPRTSVDIRSVQVQENGQVLAPNLELLGPWPMSTLQALIRASFAHGDRVEIQTTEVEQ